MAQADVIRALLVSAFLLLELCNHVESDSDVKRDTDIEDMVLNDESVQVLGHTIQRCILLLRVLVACFVYNKTQQKNDGSFIEEHRLRNRCIRGLDFSNVDWEVQMNAPEDKAMYIHRVG